MKNLIILTMLLADLFVVSARVPAFPGAEGGGKYTTGGRGGQVLFVDNLNDKGNGSLRKAIEAEGPRTVIFRVSGNIELSKVLHIQNNDLTIAGQTAPGEGICLVNYGIRLEADNVIIRFIRIRPGDLTQEENDAITGFRNKNIIIDHCSFSWANDEVVSLYDNTDFTLQWCIISESLYKSAHSKGEHGYGGIWGGLNASFHHNLLSDHSSRNPRFCGSRYTGNPESEITDFRNNVIYNWGNNSVYGGEEGNYNMVNNYYKAGPATRKDARNRILDLTQTFFDPKYSNDTLGAGSFYVSGNIMEGDKKASRDNWGLGVHVEKEYLYRKDLSRLTEPVPFTEFKWSCARKAYKKVLRYAGASLYRDAVDQRVIGEAKSGKERYGVSYEGGGNGIIDSQTDVGGWPPLKSLPPPIDSDSDGIPDEWEKKNDLDPNNPVDASAFSLNEDYSNIEMYINSLVKGI